MTTQTYKDFFGSSNETGSSSSQTSSGISSGDSSFSPNVCTSDTSLSIHTSPSRKEIPNIFDNDLNDYSNANNDTNTISSISSKPSSSKRKKYDYDACVKEVKPDFHVGPVATNIMKKLGYETGKGLGKNKQGITAPIEVSKQHGRSGIGHKINILEPTDLEWNGRFEKMSIEEYPLWLEGDHLPTLHASETENWIKRGSKIKSMDSLSDFCDQELLNDIIDSKSVFDDYNKKDLLDAVKRSNPFETISNGIFLNRGAMKMANIDRVFNFMFTEPVDSSGTPVISEMDLLYFADVCAGPGGFSEYILWKKNWKAKGIGFTLRNECDFTLENFKAGTPETFEPYYGEKQDGNIYDPANIESLTKFVMSKTENCGVHFMMADGGISVVGKENIQELMSKRLYLCQMLVALCVVRTDGHFVCKLFDIFSPFSVGLIYLLYRSFQKICIHKPNSSRPANSERYIICQFKRNDCHDIRKYMFSLNLHLSNLENDDDDLVECIPIIKLKNDVQFFNYIFKSNDYLGRRQLVHLKKVIAFCRDKNLIEPRQQELRWKSLHYWGVPLVSRIVDVTQPENLTAQILGQNNFNFVAAGKEMTNESQLKSLFCSLHDWACIPVSNHEECHFYISCKGKVYMLKNNGKAWVNIDAKVKLELSPGTLVYGEIVDEVIDSKCQRRNKFFHLIDAFQLGKMNIMNRSYMTRLKLCKLYAKALHKDWNINNIGNSTAPILQSVNIRVSDYFAFKNLMLIIKRLVIGSRKCKNEEILVGMKNEHPHSIANPDDLYSDSSEHYFFPTKGILFYKTTRNPWTVHYSKNYSKFYYYQVGKKSAFVKPADINASPIDCYTNRRLWTWDLGVGIKGESPREGVIHLNQLLNFIHLLK